MRILRQTALDTALEIEEVDVEVQVHIGGECDRSTVGRPARLRVVPRPGGQLARHAPLDGHQPDAALVGEGDRRAVGRPRWIRGRGRHGRGKVGLHVHFPRSAPAAHRGISSGKRTRILALLRSRRCRDEGEAHEERDHRFHAQPPVIQISWGGLSAPDRYQSECTQQGSLYQAILHQVGQCRLILPYPTQTRNSGRAEPGR